MAVDISARNFPSPHNNIKYTCYSVQLQTVICLQSLVVGKLDKTAIFGGNTAIFEISSKFCVCK